MSHLENTILAPAVSKVDKNSNSLLPDGGVCSSGDDKGVVHCHTVDIGAVAPEIRWPLYLKGKC